MKALQFSRTGDLAALEVVDTVGVAVGGVTAVITEHHLVSDRESRRTGFNGYDADDALAGRGPARQQKAQG